MFGLAWPWTFSQFIHFLYNIQYVGDPDPLCRNKINLPDAHFSYSNSDPDSAPEIILKFLVENHKLTWHWHDICLKIFESNHSAPE